LYSARFGLKDTYKIQLLVEGNFYYLHHIMSNNNNNGQGKKYKLTSEQQKELEAMPVSDQDVIERLMADGNSFQEAKDELDRWEAFM